MINNIRLARLEDIDFIINILNKVTLVLHSKGIKQWDYPWSVEDIKNDIEANYIYILIINEEIVGTFSIRDYYQFESYTIEPNSLYLYRIALLPHYQGKNLGVQILNFSCQLSRELNNILYLDCWAGNNRLRSFYLNSGFEYVGDFSEEDYFISIFKFQ